MDAAWIADRMQKIDAKTAKGNVILNVTAQFGADVDATLLTSGHGREVGEGGGPEPPLRRDDQDAHLREPQEHVDDLDDARLEPQRRRPEPR